jgi:hypothetical protein
MGGAIDINILAVACVMDRKGIPLEDQDELMEQVQQLAGVVLRERAAEAERKREADNTDRGRR